MFNLLTKPNLYSPKGGKKGFYLIMELLVVMARYETNKSMITHREKNI
jgi:hypothetical protein